MSVASGIYIALLLAGICLLICYHRTGRLLKCIFFTFVTGIGSLGIVWLLGRYIGVSLAFTPLTLIVSGILGIPGVVGMLLLHLI